MLRLATLTKRLKRTYNSFWFIGIYWMWNATWMLSNRPRTRSRSQLTADSRCHDLLMELNLSSIYGNNKGKKRDHWRHLDIDKKGLRSRRCRWLCAWLFVTVNVEMVPIFGTPPRRSLRYTARATIVAGCITHGYRRELIHTGAPATWNIDHP